MASFPRPASLSSRHRLGLFPLLLGALLAVLWLAGGASRGDVMGQVIVRAAAWLVTIVAVLAGARVTVGRATPVLLLLVAALALALLQLVPMPPQMWQALPGRHVLVQGAALAGEAQVWRPWSIVPDATINAASALIVPIATWLLATNLGERERRWLPAMLLCLVGASAFVGLLQFTGALQNNPLVNDTPGQVGGTFANRNHFALCLAMGCLLAPVWGVADARRSALCAPIAWGMVLLFLLTLLASGSRAGFGLGIMALLLGLLLSRDAMRQMLARYPRWVFPALVAGIVAVVALFVLLSVVADRAVSINRLFDVDQGQDMRGRGLPVVLAMIGAHFPVGSGLGSFDPMFRIHEPFSLLKPTYFNHAHNDFLEVVLDAGLPGLVLLLAALGWWIWASIRVWRADAGAGFVQAKLGSAMLFLVIVASLFDYPARTPMMMAMMVIAALWLSWGAAVVASSALPERGQLL